MDVKHAPTKISVSILNTCHSYPDISLLHFATKCITFNTLFAHFILQISASMPHPCSCAKALVYISNLHFKCKENHYQQRNSVFSYPRCLRLRLSYLLKHHVIDDVYGWEHHSRIPRISLPKVFGLTWLCSFCMLAASGLALVAPLVLYICLLPVWAVCTEVGTRKHADWHRIKLCSKRSFMT